MTRSFVCPGMQDLQRFRLGQLDEAQAAAVEEHVQQCAQCRAALNTVHRDDPRIDTPCGGAVDPSKADSDIVDNPVVPATSAHTTPMVSAVVPLAEASQLSTVPLEAAAPA